MKPKTSYWLHWIIITTNILVDYSSIIYKKNTFQSSINWHYCELAITCYHTNLTNTSKSCTIRLLIAINCSVIGGESPSPSYKINLKVHPKSIVVHVAYNKILRYVELVPSTWHHIYYPEISI